MACAILGLFAKGETVINETACIATSYPTFHDDLHKIVTSQEGGSPRSSAGTGREPLGRAAPRVCLGDCTPKAVR